MKRTISLWVGLLALALLPALAQTPAAAPAQTPAPSGPTGKVHGHVTNPTGASQTVGSVSLSNDGGRTSKYTFQVNAAGDYSGEVPPGTYMVLFRQPDTPPDKMVDSFDGVKVVLGQDVLQDIDMSRKEFVEKLPAEQQKQLEELKKHNAEALKANEVIKNLNADLRLVTQDIKDADGASATAEQTLGAGASKADKEAKAAEIKTAKYTEIETLMTKDSAAKPDASILWAQLGQAQVGLKKYDEAEATFKKALDLEANSKKQNIAIQGLANSGLGEVYARTGKLQQAADAYDAAAKVNPTQGAFYLKNEAVIFFQVNQPDAQVAAADKAIAIDPTSPILYYLKGNGLVGKTTMDDKTKKLVAPPGCLEAYQKYLQLAPDGLYAGEVKGILQGFNQTIDNSYKAPKPTKK
ncbi:MAG: tetratricopeptide repeat protein [Terracidiphilus sp.]|nr:tetratricopeptide repeat protein [Terracidiphilus sp.]